MRDTGQNMIVLDRIDKKSIRHDRIGLDRIGSARV